VPKETITMFTFNVASFASTNRNSSSKPNTFAVLSPTVYRLAADRRYHDMIAAINHRPCDLQWTDSYGSTPLHILCQAKSITSDLLQAAAVCTKHMPDAVGWKNAAMYTPLQFAIHNYSKKDANRVELILMLLQYANSAALNAPVAIGYKSQTAFQRACEVNADYSIIKAMLQIDPMLATATYISPTTTRATYYYSRTTSNTFDDTPLTILWRSSKNPRKMALLLEAAYAGTIPRRRRVFNTFSLVHAVCCIQCPHEYLEHVFSESSPSQLLQCDSDGCLPIHKVLQMLQEQPSSFYFACCLELLLTLAPQAASMLEPSSGRLPLHMALTCDTPDARSIRRLCVCYPNALRVPDPVTGLVPWLMASCNARSTLTTNYELLLIAPEMLAAQRRLMTKGPAASDAEEDHNSSYCF
jgi:hypothetical protein